MTTFLLLTLLGLGGLFFHVGFIRRQTEPHWRPRLRGASFLFLALAAVVAWSLRMQTMADERLAAFIRPYPGITGAIHVPDIPGSNSRSWLFSTRDTAKQVQAFHSDRNNLDERQLVRGLPFLALHRDGREMVISTSDQTTTLIHYELRHSGLNRQRRGMGRRRDRDRQAGVFRLPDLPL